MKLFKLLTIIKTLGVPWSFYRGLYYCYQKTGFQKMLFPSKEIDWINYSTICSDILKDDLLDLLENLSFTNINLDQIKKFYDSNPNVIEDIKKIFYLIKAGNFPFFSKLKYDVGYPPNWFINPMNGKAIDSKIHWSKIGDFSSGAGDIKYVWELSRFSFIYDLVRYYALTGDEEVISVFWQLINNWMDENKVELGPHWKCGQEIAMRSIALLFGLQYFVQSEKSSVSNILRMIGLLRFNARHIEKNFWYANKCIRNNHTISEAAGLFSIGILLPFLPESKRWVKKGLRSLNREGMRQIYRDGTYLQHSHNYQRLVIQLYTWCMIIGREGNITFYSEIHNKLSKSIMFLYNIQDNKTGRIPNYGSNDGTLLQPLSECDYLDYRPQLQTLYYILNRKFLYQSGQWNENLLWFIDEKDLPISTKLNITRVSAEYPDGGYFVLRDKRYNSFSVIRCATYKHRPAQADMLHFDFWYKGKNIFCDSGTFSYNSSFMNNQYFSSTRAHNTVVVDHKDQMERCSRFLWGSWTKSKLNEFRGYYPIYFDGEHYGYNNVIHRRQIRVKENLWWIRDEITGDFKNAIINWNIRCGKLLKTPDCVIIDSGSEKIYIKTNYDVSFKDGYFSEYYSVKNTINRMTGQCQRKEDSVIFHTVIGLGKNISEIDISSLIKTF